MEQLIYAEKTIMDSIEKRMADLDNPSRTGYLIGGFITGTLTIEERDELDAWVIESEWNMQLFEDLTADERVEDFRRWANRDTEKKLAEVKKRIEFAPKRKTSPYWRLAIAATIICLLAFSLYVLFEGGAKKHEPDLISKTDIVPGSEVAILRMSGGKQVKLDGLSDTVMGQVKISEGRIIYVANEESNEMHEVIIPRKGFYKLVLSDGTKVWINSESSIVYPSRFIGDKREVTVTGETYFEVAPDARRPFIVRMKDTEIRAIGTAFNVNGFEGTVTLTEGKVDVRDGMKYMILKPGEQLDKDFRKRSVEVYPIVAWTKNQFVFRNATIKEIMKSLRRWYDCEVIFEDDITYHFNGTIDRKVPISRVLQLLEGTGHVRFEIANDTIVIKK